MTEPDQPDAEAVPSDSDQEPFFGCLKGLATINGDLTEPVDVEWEALK